MPLVEIKDFNVLSDDKTYFDEPVKNKQEAYENFDISRNNIYTTEKVLDYLYHQKYYKLIGIDLSRETNTSIPQHINFWEILEGDGADMYFITEKQQKTILNLSLDSLIVTE